MTTTERQEFIINFLTEEGFAPQKLDDNVLFKKEGKTFIILFEERDEHFYSVLLPHIDDFDESLDSEKIHLAAASSTTKTKVAKIDLNDGVVSVSAETFYESVEKFTPWIERLTDACQAAAHNYIEALKELDGDDEDDDEDHNNEEENNDFL